MNDYEPITETDEEACQRSLEANNRMRVDVPRELRERLERDLHGHDHPIFPILWEVVRRGSGFPAWHRLPDHELRSGGAILLRLTERLVAHHLHDREDRAVAKWLATEVYESMAAEEEHREIRIKQLNAIYAKEITT